MSKASLDLLLLIIKCGHERIIELIFYFKLWLKFLTKVGFQIELFLKWGTYAKQYSYRSLELLFLTVLFEMTVWITF